MMARIGLLGRMMLILAVALFAVILAALAVGHFERTAQPTLSTTPYPRIEQAAGIIDLLRASDAGLRPTILRALGSEHLRAVIVDQPPPETDALRRAPRVEATLRAFAAPRLGDDLRAYTDGALPPRAPSALGTEGRPVRMVWRIPDGRYLVLDEIVPVRGVFPRLLGLAPGFWVGLLGLVVAALAMLTARRELRPLQRLTQRAAAFQGSPPAAPVDAHGAPDIQRLADAVHGMQERVAVLLQERSFLIGAISHDLKTYLTRLRLRAESIAETDRRLRMIGDLDAMTDLIDTSLAFARGTAVSQRRGRVDLADLAAVEAAERGALGQNVALVGEDAGDAVVSGDPVALRRVLANLVDNGCKFGRSRVEIAMESGPTSCSVLVDDDGPGVAEAECAAIFSPFYRTEGSRSRRTGGTGLGLAIARQIVEAHGGSLNVTNSRLGGARFVVDIPRPASGAPS